MRAFLHFVVVVSLVLAGGLWGFAAPAQDAPPAEAPVLDWKAVRKAVEETINTKAEAEAKRKLQPRKVAEEVKIPWPVKEPAMSPDEVKSAVEKEVAAEVDQKYPKSAIEQFKKSGDEKYRLHKVGDDVELVLRGGHGTSAVVKGRVVAMGATHVKIGSRSINLDDFEDDDRARFDADANRETVEAYAKKEAQKLLLQRESMSEELQGKRLVERMTENGYKRERQGKKEAWISQKGLFDREYERRLKDATVIEKKKLEAPAFQAAGFVMHGREWMPKEVAEASKGKPASGGKPGESTATAFFGGPGGMPPGPAVAGGAPVNTIPPPVVPMAPGQPPPGLPAGMMSPPPGLPAAPTVPAVPAVPAAPQAAAPVPPAVAAPVPPAAATPPVPAAAPAPMIPPAPVAPPAAATPPVPPAPAAPAKETKPADNAQVPEFFR